MNRTLAPARAAAWQPPAPAGRCLDSAGMTALVSSLVLVGVFAVVAASGTALVVALYRMTGRRHAESGREQAE
jgi:hypothetical protein